MGLLGGSLGMALKRRGLARRVVGVARRRESLVLARACDAIDAGSLDPCEAVRDAEVVVLCVPVLSITEMLAALAPHVGPRSIVTDVGSTKAAIVAAGEALLPGRFLGGHPMAGSEQAGIEAADAGLFEGANWALTPGPAAAPIEPLLEMVRGVGARPLVLPPEEHDRAVAVTSHLPHVLASALARGVADTFDQIPAVPRLAAGSYRDATRVAASPANLWRDICLTNRPALLAELAAFQGTLEELRAALQAEDADAVERFFAAGCEAKAMVEAAR